MKKFIFILATMLMFTVSYSQEVKNDQTTIQEIERVIDKYADKISDNIPISGTELFEQMVRKCVFTNTIGLISLIFAFILGIVLYLLLRCKSPYNIEDYELFKTISVVMAILSFIILILFGGELIACIKYPESYVVKDILEMFIK